MAKEVVVRKSGGIGFLGLLGLIFICAKLFAFEPIASWSWWWVTAPLWGPWVVIGIIAAFAFVVFVIDDMRIGR